MDTNRRGCRKQNFKRVSDRAFICDIRVYLRLILFVPVIRHDAKTSHRWTQIDADAESKISNGSVIPQSSVVIRVYLWLLSFDTIQTRARQFHRFAAHPRRRQLHGFIDFDVAGTTTKIT